MISREIMSADYELCRFQKQQDVEQMLRLSTNMLINLVEIDYLLQPFENARVHSLSVLQTR